MQEYNADSINVLEGLLAVRKRPGMYIGSVSVRGLNHLIYEIVDNSVDEAMAGVCTEIVVKLEKDGSATISDNGRGIPCDIMKSKGISAERVIMTTLHAGGKFDNNAYKVRGGLHGVGSSVVNALSKEMTVTVMRDGVIYQDTYSRGEPKTKLQNGNVPIIGKTKQHGTSINFLPDEEIFDTVRFKASAISQRLHQTAYLNPNLTLRFINERGDKEEVVFHEPQGISKFVSDITGEYEANNTCLTDVIYLQGKSGDTDVEIAFRFVEDESGENILGFCNNIHTADGGTHIVGFKTAFTKLLNQYARELSVLKDKDANFSGSETRSGLFAVVSVKHPDPMFEGQTKTKLGVEQVLTDVSAIVNQQAQLYFDRNYEVLKVILDHARSTADAKRADSKKVNLSDKGFAFEGNGKLALQKSKIPEECEIWIVEGDSAGGTAKTARNREIQAILPLRGKILNVEKASMNRILGNEEIRAMISAFGCGISEGVGNDFDISKLKYHKIVIMTDADVDGDHITILLLTFFYRFMPDLITEGYVYIAIPPLYQLTWGKANKVYLYSEEELVKWRKKNPKLSPYIQRYKGLGEMDAEQLWDTTLNPATRVLKRVEIEDMVIASQTVKILMGQEVPPRKELIMNYDASMLVLDV